ncbi:hypothetical protein, partial [Streptomyces plicatus]|uniref:hypothetical protein n=1 Tax=Streptomyces plicatus TaxID=1922 RepID=UPI001C707659
DRTRPNTTPACVITAFCNTLYLLSPASQDLEEQRGALRQHLADLGGLWRTDASRSVSLADEAGSPESL